MDKKEIPYRQIFETSKDAILLFNRSQCIECNPSTLRLFGLKNRKEIHHINQNSSAASLSPEVQNFRQFEEALINSLNRADFLFHWSFIRKDGQSIELETSIRAFDHFGQTIIMANVRDISLRVAQQYLLQEKETRYRELIDNLHDGVMILQFNHQLTDYVIVDVNKTAQRIESRESQELIGFPICSLYPFLNGHPLLEVLDKVRETNVTNSLVYHFSASQSARDNEPGWRDANIFPLPNGELALVYRDISLQRQVESEIIKLSQAIKQSPTIVFITDKDGLIEYVNPKFTEVTGYEPQECMNKNPRFLASGRTPQSTYETLWKTIKSGEIWRGEFINRRKNGQIYTEGASITPIRDNSGQISHYMAIKQDISKKKEDQDRLKSSEERYRTLFEESQDMIYIASPEGTILNINSAGVEALGYRQKKALLKENLKDHYINQSLWDAKIDILRYSKGLKDLETVMYRKDGSTIHVTESVNSVYNANNELVAIRGIVRDVSENVRRRKELEKINKELQEANQQIQETQSQLIQQEKLASIGNLAAGIAHELNNPLGFVSSNFITLQKYMTLFVDYISIWREMENGLSDENQIHAIAAKAHQFFAQKQIAFILDDLKDLFVESKEGFSRMTSIVENMRSFSRIDQSDSTAPYDINQGIENTLIVARNEIKYSSDIEKDLTPLDPIVCRGDQINQVLLNIIVNAAQAIKSQNKAERGKITIRTRDGGDEIVCEIEDNGPGIPMEIQGKIFDPFFTTKKVGEGTGLGLNISYDIIVNKHKGSLSVFSEPDKGCRFTIRLPKTNANTEETRQ